MFQLQFGVMSGLYVGSFGRQIRFGLAKVVIFSASVLFCLFPKIAYGDDIITIVAFGDSLTAGYLLPSHEGVSCSVGKGS